ncbi:ABC transporter permease [Acidimangrovimonas sediminis]|uniref:ABC transporter permease n=1 Tax=Acidimangrovimonas sediminis TaxID=2056283 RepID=UPI001304CBC8|nr:ABC transporter permease subunit [Acidimangrovimonas sediminis]
MTETLGAAGGASAAPTLRRRGGARWRAAGATLPILAVFLLLIGLPLATVIGQSVFPDLFALRNPSFAFNPAPLIHALSTRWALQSLLHSLELGMVAALTSTALGAGYAILTVRFALPLRWLIVPVPWLVFLMPSYLKALAWVLLMMPGGYLVQLGVIPPDTARGFFSLGGLVFVHTLSLFPLPAFIVGAALAGFGGELEEAARLSGNSPFAIFRKVTLPLLAPALALSLIATFAEVLSDFGLAATIAHQARFGLLTYGIYTAVADYPIDFPAAGAQALILLCLILAAVFADRMLRRQGQARLISGRSRSARPPSRGPWRWPVAGIALVVATLALWLPLAAIAGRAFTATLGNGLAVANFTTANLTAVLSYGTDANAAFLDSFGYALVTALAASLIALILAARVEAAGTGLRGAVLGLAIGTVAIPGIVLGFGYILVWNRLPGFTGWPLPHYGRPSLLVTGYIAASLPYCLIVILTALGQLSPSLDAAARLSGHGPMARLMRVTLPLILLAVLTAFLLTFIRTIFELPISQLLIPLKGSPLPPLVVNLFDHDEDGLASALSLISMLAAGGVAGTLWIILRRQLTFGRGTGDRS